MNLHEMFTRKTGFHEVHPTRRASGRLAKWIGTFVLMLSAAAPLPARAGVSGRGQGAIARRANLARTLEKLDRKWLDAEQHEKTSALAALLTGQYVEVLPGGRVGTKGDTTNWLAMMRRRSGRDFTLDDFKLRAFYGNVVLATDHMTQAGRAGRPDKAAGEIVGTKVFVREGGKWKLAASLLLPLGHFSALAARHTGDKRNGAAGKHTDLEKQLWETDQKWEAAIRNRDLAFMKKLYAPQCFIVLASGRWINKQEILAINANPRHDLKVKPFPDDFRLRAVYGNFAIATDRTVFREGGVPNGPTPGEYRTLKFFIRQNGMWRSAGASDVPIPPA